MDADAQGLSHRAQPIHDVPSLSLVVPSFNQAAYLGATLESIRAQDYPDLELIVVDGGSTDGSRELIAAHAARIAWWCSERDGGMYDALNKGFHHATGEIMGWLNSDDILLPGALRAVGKIFSQFPDVDWLSSLSLTSLTQDGTYRGYATIEGYSRAAFLDGGYLPGGPRHYGWIPQESTFWRRSLWEKSGGHLDSTLSLAGDFELWCRFFEHADLVGTTTPIGAFRTHAAQKSRAMSAYLAEARRALAEARRRQCHSISKPRHALLTSRIATLPGLRGPLARKFGYPARQVVADATGRWLLTSYSFL